MAPDVRKMLISLLHDEQKSLGLSNRAFASKLNVSAPWLNRFYEDMTKVREGSLDSVIKYFKKNSVEELVTLAEERQLNDEANELNVAGGFTTWGLPLFLLFFENRLPKGVTINFTKNKNDGGMATPVREWNDLVESLAAGDVPLNASDLIRYSNQDTEEFDVILIPEDLREDLTASGIFKIATLSTGFGVTLYVIGKNVSSFNDLHGKPWEDQKDDFINILIKHRQHIKKVYQIPGTAALNQWDVFLSSKTKVNNHSVYSLLPELRGQRENLKMDYLENPPVTSLPNDDDFALLVAYEPFANTFYHENYDAAVYKYHRFNLSRWIDRKICMVLLANKTALDSKHKSVKIRELINALQTVVVTDEYNDKQVSIAELFFKKSVNDLDEWDRLFPSLNDLKYRLEKSELVSYLFGNK